MATELADLLRIGAGDVVAVVGAGGKHTLMARLAVELPAAGRPVVLTSTTNLHRGAFDELSLIRTAEPEWETALTAALDRDRRAVVVERAKGPGMEIGVPPDAIRRLRAVSGDAVILVKADGARKRLIKAPGPGEPSLPPEVDSFVVVCALAAIGRPLEEALVHRLDVVRAIAPDDPISPASLVAIANLGYSPHIPPAATASLYLSHAVDDAALRHARAIAGRVSHLYESIVAADTIEGRFHLLS